VQRTLVQHVRSGSWAERGRPSNRDSIDVLAVVGEYRPSSSASPPGPENRTVADVRNYLAAQRDGDVYSEAAASSRCSA